MEILIKLEKTIGGSTLYGKTGIINKVLEYIEKPCIFCKVTNSQNRPLKYKFGQTKDICNECYKTLTYKQYIKIKWNYI